MKTIVSLFLTSILIVSCNQPEAVKENPSQLNDGVVVAENIIYDVILKAETDDEWEIEKVSGYDGEKMINSLFEQIYSGSVEVSDYFTEEPLTIKDIERIEKEPGYERVNIGKIQFTEDWYYIRETMEIRKVVKNIVFGYRLEADDNSRVGYLAAFKIEF